MQNVALLTFFIGLSMAGQAQEVLLDTNYYAPPPVVRKQTSSLQPQLDRLDEVRTWYVGLEGGLRSDRSILNNSLDGLIGNASATTAIWGVSFGHTYRGVWTVESGYLRAPIHLNITVVNGSNPFDFAYLNSGYGLPLRVKRRLGSARQAKKGAVWLTGGGWLVPNGNGQTGDFNLIGYSFSGRSRVDTLLLSSTTTIANQITGIAELGLESTIRLTSSIELNVYVRKYWGLGSALKADLNYTINGSYQQQATLRADGSGWGFGVALHYIYGRQHGISAP